MRAHFLGSNTPLSSPDDYLSAIGHLLDFYHLELLQPLSPTSPGIPLVINTQGWIKGLGEDLLGSIETMGKPTHVFAFEADAEEEGNDLSQVASHPLPWQPDSHSPAGYTHRRAVLQLEHAPESPLQSRYRSSDFRLLSTVSYFHSAPEPSWDFSRPMLSWPPWQTTIGDGSTIDRVYLVGEGSDGILPEDLTRALDGSLVALLERLGGAQDEGTYLTGRKPPSFENTNCVGLAVIRAIQSNVDGGLDIQLLTPLSGADLGKARILVRNGAMELPTCMMLDWAAKGSSTYDLGREAVPFLDYEMWDGVGLEKRAFRRNLMRKNV